jgi:hypothetical protein
MKVTKASEKVMQGYHDPVIKINKKASVQRKGKSSKKKGIKESLRKIKFKPPSKIQVPLSTYSLPSNNPMTQANDSKTENQQQRVQSPIEIA